MALSYNRVELMGHLGRDIEIRDTQFGKVAALRVATSRRWHDRATGEIRTKTEWHSVKVYGDQTINAIERLCKKGALVQIWGEIETRTYTDKQSGAERQAFDIVVTRNGGHMVNILSLRDNAQQETSADQATNGHAMEDEAAHQGHRSPPPGSWSAYPERDPSIPF